MNVSQLEILNPHLGRKYDAAQKIYEWHYYIQEVMIKLMDTLHHGNVKCLVFLHAWYTHFLVERKKMIRLNASVYAWMMIYTTHNIHYIKEKRRK